MRRTSLSLIRSPYRRSRRSGATLLVVVSAVSVLLGCAALTIDVGYYSLTTTHAQTVADACALAAAGEPIIGHEQEVADRVDDTLAANQQQANPAYIDDGAVVTYGPGQTLPGYGTLGARDQAVMVTVRVPVQLFFSQVFGISQRVVLASASALRTPSGNGQTVVFAIDPEVGECGVNVDGSQITINGLTHSNTRVNISGTTVNFTGAVEWVNELTNTGTGVTFGGGTLNSTVQNDPIDFTSDDFGVYTREIYGDFVVSRANQIVFPGCYRVHGNVIISGSRVIMPGVTFVADGQIVLSGPQQSYSPNRRGIFACSLSYDPAAISVSSVGTVGAGTLYAPHGGIDLTGSGVMASTMVGRTIHLGGRSYTISRSPDAPDGPCAVKLAE